ncbi:uroporphyrinogen-III C-methyltransferase [Portibacter lacus]|uniref:uroporphyrinogen-III C-methyltransferase n=1 Tax=Portibacter lacus TaxID=1099794 RepID=A0AA37SRR7_9BACT|nr:uroporphyrinogen-III C-methyltransferase [Portibacter lacus]GLR18324.1 hypothetical protein GCM10007940_29400 [Portibacter lacus]
MKQEILNKITLVGAGPGDPDLITLRGLKAIQAADVVLYDALVHPSLVDEAPSHALKIYVGKRAAHHYATQDEINEKLIDFVKLGHVVRLKGGDPFVFGRGFEELVHAEKLNIPVEIIPGLSSATAVSAWNGLPITLRNVSRSFHVVTAVGKNGKLSNDLKQAVHLDGTVVILMGLGKLDEIVQQYIDINKEDLGIAVIQNGTLSHQKAVYGKISEIQDKVSNASIATPAIIYIGEVVNAFLEHTKSINNATEKSVISGVFQA